MILILIYSIWILIALLMGFSEAYYYSAVYNKVIKRIKYDHIILTGIRATLAGILLYFTIGIDWEVLFIGASLMTIFSYFHNGMYYLIRNKLDDIYPLKWKDHTSTSDAIFNFDYYQRIWLCWIGFIFLLISFAL